MIHSEIVTPTAPTRNQWITALTAAALLIVVAAVTLPIANTPLPACMGFLPLFAGMAWIGDIMTAALLFSQAQAAQDRSTAQLGTAFLFSGIAMIPHLVTIPGIFSVEPLLGAPGSAAWLWCFWHAGFSIYLAHYALRRRSAGTGELRLTRTVVSVVAVQLVLTVIGSAGLPFLPNVMKGNAYGGLITSGGGPATLACSIIALGIVVHCLRGRATVDLWVSVAALTCTLDIALVLRGGSRFSLGWYVARVMSLGTGITVLIALLSEVADMFRKMSAMNRHLRQLSATDGMTGIANRRAFDEALTRNWAAARREQTAISLLIVDIDHFKAFNDTYGHPAGDDCIRRIALMIASHARRPHDVAARLGGEEFGLLMPTTEEAGAAMIAERIRANIEALQMPNAGSRVGCVSISVGTATLRPFGPEHGAAILTEAADQALYESKSCGRNRVSAFQGAPVMFDIAALEIPRRQMAGAQQAS